MDVSARQRKEMGEFISRRIIMDYIKVYFREVTEVNLKVILK